MNRLKHFFILLCTLCIVIATLGCSKQEEPDILATTLPVYEITVTLCQGTGLTVSPLVTENISCLHDYTLQVSQMRMIESSDVLVISGAGLEDFLNDIIGTSNRIVDASEGISLHLSNVQHDHAHKSEDEHDHEHDPHFWLSPQNGIQMSRNICNQLTQIYPKHAKIFTQNLNKLEEQFALLSAYADAQLSGIAHRELVTFHDGFSYMAEAFQLNLLYAIEEDSGSEASAKELIEIISLVQSHKVPAIFTERNGSTSAAQIISRETDATIYELDMAMSEHDYFSAMYHNIDTLREALE